MHINAALSIVGKSVQYGTNLKVSIEVLDSFRTRNLCSLWEQMEPKFFNVSILGFPSELQNMKLKLEGLLFAFFKIGSKWLASKFTFQFLHSTEQP